jgi:hypothetical protein
VAAGNGGGVIEIALAIFFIQPYPTHYVGTVPYCVALGLIFGGWNMLLLASRARRLAGNPGLRKDPESASAESNKRRLTTWSGPPASDERALTVHVWTPVGSAKSKAQHQPIIDRYIAAVDRDGVISTGHAALESPKASTSASTRPSRSTVRQTISRGCCEPRRRTTYPDGSSLTIRQNPRHGARRPFRSAFATTMPSACRTGTTIGRTRPTT